MIIKNCKTRAKFRETVPQLRRLVAGFPPRWPGFEPRSDHVGFVMDQVALGQIFSEYFRFPSQFLFHRLLHIHHLSPGAGTIGRLVADVRSRLKSHPNPRNFKKKTKAKFTWTLISSAICLSKRKCFQRNRRTYEKHSLCLVHIFRDTFHSRDS
jgi:hypothetical protein